METLKKEGVSPVFSTKIRRHQQTVGIGDAEIEVAFDEGTLIAGERTEAVCEVELELKSGEVGALYELALSLLEPGPLRLGSESKAERGYNLSSGTQPIAKKASDSGIAPTDIVDEAIAKILQACLHHLMANLAPAEKGKGPEGIHQLRVALRRLRSAISAVKRRFRPLHWRRLAPTPKIWLRRSGRLAIGMCSSRPRLTTSKAPALRA